MTGNLRIGGAIMVGVILILAGFSFAQHKSATQEAVAGSIASVSPERGYITPEDSDRDGVPDWEEGLFLKVDTPESTGGATSTYEAPTTFTGKFSEAFFKDYMEGKGGGADMSDPSELVEGAVSAIEANTTSKVYTRADIHISSDASDSAIRAYGNEITTIIAQYSLTNENEARIVKRALEKNDPEELTKLAPIKKVYENLIAATLLVSTPQPLIAAHLQLLTSYSAIITDITAMEQTFTDPLYALARTKRYQADAQGLLDAFLTMNAVFNARGILYAHDEPGNFFNSFSP